MEAMRWWVIGGCFPQERLPWDIFCGMLDNPEIAVFIPQTPWLPPGSFLKESETWLDPYPKTCPKAGPRDS